MRWLIFIAACSSPRCPGAAPSTRLYEDYCQNGEAARCYLTQKPSDGF
jgi:hypothetical protein